MNKLNVYGFLLSSMVSSMLYVLSHWLYVLQNIGSSSLLGPAPTGLVSVLSFIVLSIYIVIDHCENGYKKI
ncbi:hypothetical protein H8356DRAFT_1629386 [Neocallimastix lanati (nom. inval.)]|nr:hypothetical protein H8356DRAFT_1629386 [Neocallimastix sp. JGI-2020a]